MNYSGLSWIITSIVLGAVSCLNCEAQTGAQPTPPATTQPQLPLTTQIKKTIVFLETDCLHDFAPQVAQLTPDALAKMSEPQMKGVEQQLIVQIMHLQNLKATLAKLSPDEMLMLKPETLNRLDVQALGNLLVKMSSLTEEDVDRLTPAERSALPVDQIRGTGFIVIYNDTRIPVAAAGKAGDGGFQYLVTNRHVAQPGIENDKPCAAIVSSSLLVNRKPDSTDHAPRSQLIAIGNNVKWFVSTDASVDLAVLPFPLSQDIYDFIGIPLNIFTTQEMVDQKVVVEGDPIVFSGLFMQSFVQLHSLEPIVRSGTLAMVPNGQMETTLHKLGRVYLAEVHTFGGNSGSPVFIDTSKFAGIIGLSYKLLGVISGYMYENSDLTLQVTTSLSGNLAANSDVSIVVPAVELKKLLDVPELQAARDSYVASLPKR